MKRLRPFLFLCLLFPCLLGGCGITPDIPFQNGGTTCGNITMGRGGSAYSNGFIYTFSLSGGIYEYDLESNKTILLAPSDNTFRCQSLYATDQYLYYWQRGLQCMTKDGQKSTTVFERPDGCCQLFIQGEDSYFLNGVGGQLFYRNLTTGAEKVLAEHVNSYHTDAGYLYAISIPDAADRSTFRLLRFPLDTLEPEVMPLQMAPIAVYASGSTLILSSMGTYQLVRYADGTETQLPVYSLFYQVLDHSLIYMDEADFNSADFYTVRSYDLETGEIQTLMDHVISFTILENRYVVARRNGSHSDFYSVYDWETQQEISTFGQQE